MLGFFKKKWLQNKVIENKHRRTKEGFRYQDTPNVSLIIQSFNQKNNIKPIISALRKGNAEEIIVIDDGSLDNSYKKWLKHLTRPNDFLIHANDLGEVRTCDRAMRMAKGEFVCLLQDDDLPPDNAVWLNAALYLFRTFPKLLLLSGYQGVKIASSNPYGSSHIQNTPQDNRIYQEPLFKEVESGIPFMFCMTAYRAPLLLRRQEFLEIGGLDQTYAPFMCDDAEASLRAWQNGYQVGFYPAEFKKGVSIGGTRLFNREMIPRWDLVNQTKMYAKYGKDLQNGKIQALVDHANEQLQSISLAHE